MVVSHRVHQTVTTRNPVREKGSMKWLLKRILPRKFKRFIQTLSLVKVGTEPFCKRVCNICEYERYFTTVGRPLRIDALCPNCGSMERHRLLILAVQRGGIPQLEEKNSSVLHFAAEPCLEQIFRNRFASYATADLFTEADLKLDMECIDVADEQYNVVVANHVLEHVDDKKASTELSRILVKGGILVCQVPLIDGWESTYEDDSITSDAERLMHYGQEDHVRYYGADFRQRISAGGFKLINEFTSEGEDVLRYGLLRGEKTFVFEKL